jgi:hypothetical protein
LAAETKPPSAELKPISLSSPAAEGGINPMNIKELIDIVSSDTGVPAAQVRKVSIAMLNKFAGLIDSQTDFTSPNITIKAFTSPAKPASEGKPAKPETKFGRMKVRVSKSDA